MQTNIYLSYSGNCEEAFRYYEDALGGKIEILQTYGSAPSGTPVSEEMKEKIGYASIRIGDTRIFGMDAPPDRAGTMGGFLITLSVDTVAEAEKIFAGIAAGGTTRMPLMESFFAKRFGMAADKFGVPWMVLCQLQSK